MSEREILVEPPRDAKRQLIGLALIVVLVAFTFFFGLGGLALLGPDEPRYAEVAREMFVSGDYISPRLCGCLWFEKPALYYWAAAAAYHLFPVGEFAARLPSALAAAATVIFLFISLKRSLSLRLGLGVAVVLATSGIFLGYARAATPDMLLAAAMTAALISGWLAAHNSGRAQVAHWALCWAAMGFATLAKGLVGIVLTVTILVLYLLIAGIRIRWQLWLAGIMIFALVAALWYLPVTLRHGRAFIDEFFIAHHFQRYLSNQYGHPQPIYFFPFIAFVGVAPWSFFLIPAVARLRRLKPRADKLGSLLLLAWIWAAVPVIFFSFSGSKLPGYILMAFPALAIIIGAEVERVWRGDRAGLLKVANWLTAISVLLIGVGFTLYLRRQGLSPDGGRMLLYYAPLCIGIIGLLMLLRNRPGGFTLTAPMVVVSVVIGTTMLLFPRMNDALSLRSLSLQAAAALQPGERIAFYILKEFAPVFYAEGRVVCDVGEGAILNALHKEKLLPALETHPGLIVFSRRRWRDELLTDPRFDAELLATQGDTSAIRLRLRHSED